MTKKKRVLVALRLKDKNAGQVLQLGRSLVKGMMLNPSYPAPNPSVPTVIAHLDELLEAQAKCGTRANYGSAHDYMRRDSAKVLVETDLKLWALYAMNKTPDDAVSLSMAGFPLKSDKVPTGTLPAIQNLHQDHSSVILHGTLKLRWDKPPVALKVKVKIYRVLRSGTPRFEDAVEVAIVSKTTFTDKNPIPGKAYYWVIPVNAYGNGVTSNVCMACATFPL